MKEAVTANTPMDPHAARQRADRLAVADVDPDVRAAAPDHEVADPGVGAAREAARLVPAVQRPRGAQVAVGDRTAVAGALERVDDEPGAVEGPRAGGAVDPRAAELRAGDADDLLGLAAARPRLHDGLHDRGHDGRRGRGRVADDRVRDGGRVGRGRIRDDRIGPRGSGPSRDRRPGRSGRRGPGPVGSSAAAGLAGAQGEQDGAREGEWDERSCAHASSAQWSSFLPARRAGARRRRSGAHERARTRADAER